MAKLLLIETATEVCGAALSIDGEVVALSEDQDCQNHASALNGHIQRCMTAAKMRLNEIDGVAVSDGPGSYTSLRVGVSTAKGICYALNKPLIAVETLAALALASKTAWMAAAADNAPECLPPCFVPMLDARRKEVWLAAYDMDMNLMAPPQPLILENNSLNSFFKIHGFDNMTHWPVFSGNGIFKLENMPERQGAVDGKINKCSADYLSYLANLYFENDDYEDVISYTPFYMKPPNITSPKNIEMAR